MRAHYAISGCDDNRLSVLFFEETPKRGKAYLCCCGREAVIRSYTLWGWWVICFQPGCILHWRYLTADNARRRALIHDGHHRGDVHIYEGTRTQMYGCYELITQSQLGE